jgi:hypothetical protein
MSRQRFIHPDIFTSEDFISLCPQARLLWIGMFTTADDDGRGRASPISLRAAIFPGDNCGPDRVRTWTRQVADRGMIRLYVVEGVSYYDIPSWARWQKPKYHSPSKLPPYQQDTPIGTGSGPEPDRIGTGSGSRVGLGRVGLGREGLGREWAGLPPGFVRFWDTWKGTGRPTRKKQAAEEWSKTCPCNKRKERHSLEAHADAIVAKLQLLIDHKNACDKAEKWHAEFPDPNRWLRDGRWNDDVPLLELLK